MYLLFRRASGTSKGESKISTIGCSTRFVACIRVNVLKAQSDVVLFVSYKQPVVNLHRG